MKRLFTAVVVALGLASGLAGCGTLDVLMGKAVPIAVPKDLPPQLQLAQGLVNESNILLIGIQRTIRQNLQDKILLPLEAKALNEQAIEYGKQVDRIQIAIRAGDLTAKDKADLIRQGIIALHRRVAQKARTQ